MKKYTSYIFKLAYLSFGVLFILACSTEKEAWINRGYHNMTAHYNGYFNAKEIIKESRAGYNETFQEDYTKILPIYIYADDETVEGLRQSMETAIEKTSNVIGKNSMPDPEKKKGKKREEWCKWIDDNWYVMAQANFYKREFGEAKNIFNYVKTTYPSQEIVYWADLWLAKTAIETKDYASALSTLELLKTGIEKQEKDEEKAKKKSSSKRKKKKAVTKKVKEYDIARPLGKSTQPAPYPKNMKAELYTTYADLHLRRSEYNDAVTNLLLAIEHHKKKKIKTRLTFILAQVYEEMGNKSDARSKYEEVTKMTAPYEMEFYATIYKALLFDGGDTKGLRAQLLKMAKDEKNKDYLDQIYYVLAELDFSEDQKENAIANLEKSARFSTTNSRQKALTYVKLGDVYYADKFFPQAKEYYDSSLTVIKEDYENYDEILERSEGLTSLVENLEIYERQDSLLNLVNLGSRHYDKVINDIIEAKKLKEKEEFEERQNNPSGGTGGNFNNNFGSGTEWYFYNKEAIAFGQTEFKSLWGDRKLDDNWRRSNRTSVTFEKIEDGDTTLTAEESDPYSPEYYLKDLPLTEEAQKAANDDIAEALYNLGVIYKQKLNEPTTGLKYFELLVSRFKDSKRSLPGMYQLYLGYKTLNKASESEKYKKIILEDYPDSEYAKIILNPDFKKQEQLARKAHSKEYTAVYEHFLSGEFATVVSKSDEVVARREVNEFIPKYLLLKAYALGGQNPEDLASIQAPLEILVQQHAETEEGTKAKIILEKLKNQSSIQGVKDGSSTFIYNAEMEHFFVLVFPNAKGSINPAKKAISNFNQNLFGSQELKLRNTFINPENQIIVIRSFKNKHTALQYLKSFKANKTLVKEYNQDLDYFVITHKNYASLFAEKNIEEYLKFYGENYE